MTTNPSAPQSHFPVVPDNVKTGIAYMTNTDANNSMMCWYDNASASQDGLAVPQAADLVGPVDSVVTWEGHFIKGLLFPSDTPKDFTSEVFGDAQSHNFQDKVGVANLLLLRTDGQPANVNNFANFDVFKDNGRLLYTDANFGKVYSIYYSTFNNTVSSTA